MPDHPGAPPESAEEIEGHYKSWSACALCGFEGIFRFRRWQESLGPDALGAMFDSTCPACGEQESVLVATEEIGEMTPLSIGPDDRRGQ